MAQDSVVYQGPVKLPEPDTQQFIKKQHPLISDSVQAVFNRSPVVEKEPAFYFPHLLITKKIIPEKIFKRQNEWAFMILFFCVSLLAWTRYYFRKRLRQIFQVFLSGRYYNQLIRSGDIYNERISVNLFLIFSLGLPMIIFELNFRYPLIPIPDNPFGNLTLYGFILICTLALYGVKMFTIYMAGLIFKTTDLSSEYVMTHYVFNLIEGLLLLPLIIILIFNGSDIFLQLSIVIISLVFLYRLLRGIAIGLKGSRYPPLYLLLFFLCIEILPLLVIWKLVANNYHG